ncbi:MAG TPA: DUF3052 family protein [Gemmatimonadota bacterium]|nr:DUF3052 family protein [Gemmatimonadota bacterium]
MAGNLAAAPGTRDLPRMPEKSYAHRDVLDKLGIGAETRVAVEGPVPPDLVERASKRGAAMAPSADRGPVDVVLYAILGVAGVAADLARLRNRIAPAGGIWVLTAKRSRPGYVRQEDLIPLGKEAGLVDNKICSVDEGTSAMRFVIRRADR